MLKARQIFTVSELTQDIKLILESAFPEVWVQGEVSNFRKPSSGHIYFTLKDKSSQLKCVFFRPHNLKLKFSLKDGLSVVCFGRVGVYERDGVYQLYVESIEPKGVGALTLAFEQLKEKLAKEGLFDSKYKKPIPFLPKRIGIVTSKTGAAIRDILHVLNRRFSDAEIIIHPVKVQGDGAAEEISEAVRCFNRISGKPGIGEIDVLIVTRGGGSLEDLWAFNEECVARAIFESKIPVISAVGHEIDYTISDFVADLRAPTPSAAAELVLPRKEDLKENLNVLGARLNNYISNKFDFLSHQLESLTASYAFQAPQERVEQLQQSIDDLSNGLLISFRHAWREKESLAGNLFARLESLSPLSVLARGYSVAFKMPEEEVLTDAAKVQSGDVVKIKLHKGEFIATAKSAK